MRSGSCIALFGSKGLALALTVLSLSFATVALADVLPDKPPVPANNPQRDEKVVLGKLLYFENRLSSDGTVSCNSCHDVTNATGVDALPTSKGIRNQVGGRNAPTVLNAAFLSVQFWDGRAASLEDQAKGPLTNPIEMGMPDHDAVVGRLKSIPGYGPIFEKAFPGEKNAINIDNVAKAIAAFERTLVTPDSPYDAFNQGRADALNAAQQRGLAHFRSKGCVSCHNGPAFAGPELPEGVGFYQSFPVYKGSPYDAKYGLIEDLGRYEVTRNAADKNKWRVPTLRNIARTGPYFHNGKVASLPEAVRVMARTQLNLELKEDEITDIVAFLESLSGSLPKVARPELPNPEITFSR